MRNCQPLQQQSHIRNQSGGLEGVSKRREKDKGAKRVEMAQDSSREQKGRKNVEERRRRAELNSRRRVDE